MSARTAALLLAAACAPLEADVAATAEACGIDAPAHLSAAAFDPPSVSVACLDALLEDMRADVDALEHGSGVTRYDLARGTGWDTQLGTLAGGAFAMLAFDWGVEDGWSLYGDMSVAWRRSTFRPSEEADASLRLGVLRVSGVRTPPFGAGILVHELAHTNGAKHVRCDDSDLGCDVDLDGAYGEQIRLLEAGIAHPSVDDVASHAIQSYADNLQRWVLSPGAAP